MSKILRPITEAQEGAQESLLGELKPMREKLREAITFPQLQSDHCCSEGEAVFI